MIDGVPRVKFCGLTRPDDAAAALDAGAAYLGVIFAGGPRLVDVERASAVLAHAGPARRVGVFGAQPASAIAEIADAVGLDVVQLHSDPRESDVEAVRAVFGGEVWAALRVADAELPERGDALFAAADAVVVDALVTGALGGTGTTVAWDALRAPLARLRGARSARLVLAGGLSPRNVGAAIASLAPDVVDVSSGVETAPGIKDHSLLRAFGAAARTSNRET
jgi:phosphoribosylanthranilate isomerase